MYIGDTASYGLHHLVFEVVDNSVDEALAGHCSNIRVILHTDGSCTVIDDGRGIPVDVHTGTGKSAAEVVLTTLHAGGKFESSVYKVSGGLHGVGVSVVNALSEWLEVEIRRDGRLYTQRYDRGKPQSDLQPGEKATKRGTTIRFKPDPDIFEITTFSFDVLANRLRELAFLNKGLRIQIEDERDEKKVTFHYTGGIRQFVEYINQNKTAVHPKVQYFEGGRGDTQVEVAVQYNDGYQEYVFSFANNINTREGGSHLTGFRAALTRTIGAYAQANGIPEELQGHDHRRRRPRGPDGGHLGAAPGAAVRGADEGQARQQRRARSRRVGRQRQARAGLRGGSRQRAEDRREVRPRRAGARGGAQGARAHAQEGLRRRQPAREARRLLRARSGGAGALPGGGRLGGRVGEAGAGPADPGDPAAPRQDHQRGEGALRQGALPPGDPAADRGHGHRHRTRGVRPGEAALPQGHPDDGCRRGRRAHPDAPPHVLLPPHGPGHRRGAPVHRAAPALQAEARQEREVPAERAGARARAPPPGDGGAQLRIGTEKPSGRTLSDERLRGFVGEIIEFRRLRDRLARRGGVPAPWLEAFARHRPLARKRLSRESLLQEIPRALGRPDVELAVQSETEESVVAGGRSTGRSGS